jgi:hypothetical protein
MPAMAARPGESARDFAHRVMMPYFQQQGLTVGDHASDRFGEHQNGALDVMVPSIAAGTRVLQQALSDPNVYGAIFNNQTYGYGRGPAPRDYSAGHTGDPTQDHQDHVHIFYKPGGANNINPNGMPMSMMPGTTSASLAGQSIPVPLPVTIVGGMPGGGGSGGGGGGGGASIGMLGMDSAAPGGAASAAGRSGYVAGRATEVAAVAAVASAHSAHSVVSWPGRGREPRPQAAAHPAPRAAPVPGPLGQLFNGADGAASGTMSSSGGPSGSPTGGGGPVGGGASTAGIFPGLIGPGQSLSTMGFPGVGGAPSSGPTVIGGLAPKEGSGKGFSVGGGLIGLAESMPSTLISGALGAAGGAADSGGGFGAGTAAAGAGSAAIAAAMQIGIDEINRAVGYAGQVAGIGVQGLMETFLPFGTSEFAQNNWLTKFAGGIAGAHPITTNLAGGAAKKHRKG